MTQVILEFWLDIAYDLLEDRRTIDIIVTKFLPSVLSSLMRPFYRFLMQMNPDPETNMAAPNPSAERVA